MLSSAGLPREKVDTFPSRSGLAVPVREVDDHFVGCLLESPGGCLSRKAGALGGSGHSISRWLVWWSVWLNADA